MDGWKYGWCMDGWMGEWVGGWVDGWVGGWMDGWWVAGPVTKTALYHAQAMRHILCVCEDNSDGDIEGGNSSGDDSAIGSGVGRRERQQLV
jgi:hypothetical protein